MILRLLHRLSRPRLSRGANLSLFLLREEIQIQRWHRAALRRARRYAAAQGLKLHLGCGDNLKPGWINIDLAAGADLQLDMREPLPFATGSAAVIYSEHLFEHLQYPDQAQRLLKESWRVLAPGGRFSVGVPDAGPLLHAYAAGDQHYFELLQESFNPTWCDTPLHSINFHFRQGGQHQYAYDADTLARVLAQHGFSAIRRRPFDPHLDSPRRAQGTLYMDAEKPAPEPSAPAPEPQARS